MNNAEIMALLNEYKASGLVGGKGTKSGASKNPWLKYVKDYRLKYGNISLKIISQQYKSNKGLSEMKEPSKKSSMRYAQYADFLKSNKKIKYTVKQLKQMAKQAKIKGITKLKKEGLMKKLNLL